MWFSLFCTCYSNLCLTNFALTLIHCTVIIEYRLINRTNVFLNTFYWAHIYTLSCGQSPIASLPQLAFQFASLSISSFILI